MIPTVTEIINGSDTRYQAVVYTDTNLRTVAFVSPILHDTHTAAQLDSVHAVAILDNTLAYPRAIDTHCACCATDTIRHQAIVHGDVVGVCAWACADRLDNIWRPRKVARNAFPWRVLASLATIGACIVASVL